MEKLVPVGAAIASAIAALYLARKLLSKTEWVHAGQSPHAVMPHRPVPLSPARRAGDSPLGLPWNLPFGQARSPSRQLVHAHVCASSPQVGEVTGLQVYPVKSCQGHSMTTMHLDRFGAVNDRCLPSLFCWLSLEATQGQILS